MTTEAATTGVDIDPAAGEGVEDASGQAGETEYEDGGVYTFEDGKFVPFEPPTPGRHNESSGRLGAKREPTIGELRARLDQQVGKPSLGRDPWADIAGEA